MSISTYLKQIADKLNGVTVSALPSVSASDNGKVMTVVSGAWTKAAVPTELPAVSASDNGKVLKVVNGAWAAASAE